jgi:hypothetical protein
MPNLSGGSFLNEIYQNDSRLGTLLSRVIKAVNQTANTAGVAPVGQSTRLAPPDSVNVSAAGEMMHVSITDNSAADRTVHYFTQVSNNPQFAQPITIHHGPSRTSAPFTLPTKDGSGATHNWYVRSFRQRPGGPPSDPITYGGSASPTAVTMSGSTQFNLLPSTGSGTGDNTGTQGAQGFGKQPTRPPTGPKRQVN